MIAETTPAIVGIVNRTDQHVPFQSGTEQAENGTGSGVIYQVSADAAYIVTNNHVIEGATEIESFSL